MTPCGNTRWMHCTVYTSFDCCLCFSVKIQASHQNLAKDFRLMIMCVCILLFCCHLHVGIINTFQQYLMLNVMNTKTTMCASGWKMNQFRVYDIKKKNVCVCVYVLFYFAQFNDKVWMHVEETIESRFKAISFQADYNIDVCISCMH